MFGDTQGWYARLPIHEIVTPHTNILRHEEQT
jgi:hypothetical protein